MWTKALIGTLERFAKLSERDKPLLEGVSGQVRAFDRREDPTHAGDKPDQAHLVLDGWAACNTSRPNGDQPIMAWLIPGDFCDVQATFRRCASLSAVMRAGLRLLIEREALGPAQRKKPAIRMTQNTRPGGIRCPSWATTRWPAVAGRGEAVARDAGLSRAEGALGLLA
ncbi:MAG TPA: hypothetical protein VM899_16630 [Rubellimicrobium sp.]|nr:hypothetical protein [Rubellimicrobium sp.]